MSECVKVEWKGSCCCSCKFHLQDFHSCVTDWQRHKAENRCICSEPKGWICACESLENGHYHSGWSEHGMCEMWEKADES